MELIDQVIKYYEESVKDYEDLMNKYKELESKYFNLLKEHYNLQCKYSDYLDTFRPRNPEDAYREDFSKD